MAAYLRGGLTRRGMMVTAARKLAPSDKVNIAVIGAGGQGAANMAKLTGQNIVATADVDYDHVYRALLNEHFTLIPERVPLKAAYDKATRYKDYRVMFDTQKDIDAVLIATPDHHHAVAARMAMERGLHVYVQKPLTYSVEESRKLGAMAAADPKLVTQMGNQGHSGDDGRRVIELIRGGVIGPVKEVHVWTNRPVWPQGIAKPAPTPTPAGLDWPTWLGPANVDWGYNEAYAHFNWRGWVPFGSGPLGDTSRSGRCSPACRPASRPATPAGPATPACGRRAARRRSPASRWPASPTTSSATHPAPRNAAAVPCG
jgi:hypothetical protein